MTDIRGQVVERVLSIEAGRGEGAERSYPAALSSEQPVRQGFGWEVLSHDKSAVNMARAVRGLPLLFNHKNDDHLGRVADIRLDGDKLRGALRFSPNNERARQVQADVDGGFLGDVSIRYSIDEYEHTKVDGNDAIRVTKWTPMEVSVVTVPADSSVGIGRSQQEGTSMTTENTGATPDKGDGSVAVVDFLEARRSAEREGAESGAKRERERIAEIDKVFSPFAARGGDYAALKDECIRKGSTVDQARASLLALVAGTPEATPTAVAGQPPQPDRPSAPFVQAGRDAGEKLVEGLQRAIELRAGMIVGDEAKREVASNEFTSMSLPDMIRTWGARNGIRVNFPTASQMIGHVLTEGRRAIPPGMTTTDFAGIVANVAGKSLLAGWEEAMTTWRQWVRIGTVNDFRRVNRTGLSGADLLSAVVEGAEYTHGDMADRTEYLTAGAYGKKFAITRAALLADDVGAFSAIPRKMGRAADLTVNKTVIDLLCSASGVGPTLNQDSTALFDAATHVNYVTSGAAPSVATLDVGRKQMARQTDPNNGMPLNIKPKYLMVPSALETTAKVLIASEKDPLGTTNATGGATTPNIFYNALTVISEPYLDDSSHTKGTTAWYLMADQNMHDTFEVAFVGGQSTPYLESRDGWDVDGIEYKVRIEFGVSALDFRGMFRNDGD